MPLKVVRSPQAERDYEDVWLTIALSNPRAAEAVLDDLIAAERLLAEFPLIGQVREDLAPALRHWPVRDYLIVYRVEAQVLDIVRLLHGARNLYELFEPE